MSKTFGAWHLIYNLDGSFRGYEGALDADGNPRPSLVYAQEGRLPSGSPDPNAAHRREDASATGETAA